MSDLGQKWAESALMDILKKANFYKPGKKYSMNICFFESIHDHNVAQTVWNDLIDTYYIGPEVVFVSVHYTTGTAIYFLVPYKHRNEIGTQLAYLTLP